LLELLRGASQRIEGTGGLGGTRAIIDDGSVALGGSVQTPHPSKRRPR
jgi:hypothetical protein